MSLVLVNNANTRVYSAIKQIDGGTAYCYFTTFDFGNGSVIGSRYKLSVNCNEISSMAEQNSNIYYKIDASPNYIAVYYPSNSSFGPVYASAYFVRITSYPLNSR